MSLAVFNQSRLESPKFQEHTRTITEFPILIRATATESKSSGVTSPIPARTNRTWSRVIWSLFLILLTAAIAVFQPWKSLGSNTIPGPDVSSEVLRTVQIDRPSPAVTASVLLPATLRPWQTTVLSSRVSGYLAAWHSDLGTSVQTGDVLAELDTPELDQELSASESMAREATAAVIQAKAERIEAEADLQAAEAQLSRAKAETELAQIQLARREKLLTKKVIAQEEYDVARKDSDARLAEVAAAEADVSRRRASLETRSAIIEVRNAAAKSRQSNVERLKELQAFKRIVAPFDGTITRRNAEIGMLVTAGKESLFVVEDMSRIRVQLNVPQAYSSRVQVGLASIIRIPESNLPEVSGTITRISESVDSSNRTMLAEIELANAEMRLQPGSYVQVELKLPQDSSIWTVPTNTLSMRVSGSHVAVVNEDNQISLKRVTLGRDLGTRIMVLDGIQGDERLVINPSDDLVNGLPIQVEADGLPHQVAASHQK